MYKETAKQAKAVLRIPRLCHTYHNKIQHLNEQQSSKLLEDLYNEYYAATIERRRGNLSMGLADTEQRPLSKIEESLLDRSVFNASVGTRRSTDKPHSPSPVSTSYLPDKGSSIPRSGVAPQQPGGVQV